MHPATQTLHVALTQDTRWHSGALPLRSTQPVLAEGLYGERASEAREVLVTKDEWEALKSQRDAEESAEQAELPSE